MEFIIKLMIIESKAYNRYLTNEYLDKLPMDELMTLVHPLSREYYNRKIREIERENKKKL